MKISVAPRLLLLWSALLYLPAFAETASVANRMVPVADLAISVANHTEVVPIGEGVEFLEDPDGRLLAEDVLNVASGWQRSTARVFNQGYSNSVWWLRFRVDNLSDRADWLLEVSYPVLDYLDVHVIQDQRILQRFSMGDKLPYANRPIDHRYFVSPIRAEPQATTTILMRVHSSSSIQMPLKLWDKTSFDREHTRITLVQGIYYGSLLIIALYNLLIYLVLGERTYLYYVIYVLCMTVFIACLDGWAYQYLWPTYNQWNDQAILVSLAAVCAFGVAFSRYFLEIPSLSRVLSYGQVVAMVLAVVVGVAAMLLPYGLMVQVLIPLASAICIFVLITGLYALVKGRAAARYYTLAWTFLLVGGVILALNKFNLIPRNLFTDNTAQLGSLLEVLLLSFALAERINQERSLRFYAQQQALLSQVRANEVLEQRVNERTQALEAANRKLHELSNTDQLTELKNRRFLDAQLTQEFMRAARYQHAVAVMLIDVDHFKLVNDTHGHPVGDDCLQEIAHRIQSHTRWPSDLVARYGGEEFCVVLPETDAEGALQVAERMRQSIAAEPVMTRTGPLNLTVSIGLCAGTPLASTNPQTYISLADVALYQSKQQGRDRVTISQQDEGEPLAFTQQQLL